MTKPTIQRQGGFTLVELLVAMAVFTFMLLIISVSFIGIIHITQSGTASRNAQQTSRLILETVERQLRSSQRVAAVMDPASGGRLGRLCLYTDGRYVQYAVDGANNLRVGDIALPAFDTCAAPSAATLATWQLLNDNATSVRRFVPTTSVAIGSGLDGGTASLQLSVTGNGISPAELTADQSACLPGAVSQFCSVTNLATSAELRGGLSR